MKPLFALLLLLPACTESNPSLTDDGPVATDDAALPTPDLSQLSTPDLSSPPSDGGPAHCAPLDPRAIPAELTVQPDSGEKPFVDVLASAQKSIRVMVYLMGRGGILDTIEQKAKAGVSVRVILDRSQTANQKYYDELLLAGAQVKWSSPQFTYMHAKTLISDGKDAVVSTGNYSLYNLQRERNFAVRLTDPDDTAALTALFDADWAGTPPDLSCTRLVVSPINARERILDLIDSATQTLTIESMQFADSDARASVAARKKAGVDVRVLLADPSWIDANTDAATFLKAQGIPVRWRTDPNIHVKAILADGARGYAGSENLSYTSLSKNREIGVLMAEPTPTATLAATFEKDWATATPF